MGYEPPHHSRQADFGVPEVLEKVTRAPAAELTARLRRIAAAAVVERI